MNYTFIARHNKKTHFSQKFGEKPNHIKFLLEIPPLQNVCPQTYSNVDIVPIIQQIKTYFSYQNLSWKEIFNDFFPENNINLLNDNIECEESIANPSKPLDACTSFFTESNEVTLSTDYSSEEKNDDFETEESDLFIQFKLYLENELKEVYSYPRTHLTGEYEPSEKASLEDKLRWAKQLELIYKTNYLSSSVCDNSIQQVVTTFDIESYKNLFQKVKNPSSLSGQQIDEIFSTFYNFDQSTLENSDFYLKLINECNFVEFMNVYEKQLTTISFSDILENEFTEFYNDIINDLPNILTKFIIDEENTTLSYHQHKDYKGFKKIYSLLSPIINTILPNTQHKQILKYYLEVYRCTKLHDEKRANMKPFLPAGQCFYGEKIFINSDLWDSYKKFGLVWATKAIRHVYLHELGHAIDYPYTSGPILSKHTLTPKKQISANKFFQDLVKQNYKNSRSLTAKQKKLVHYYSFPKIKVKIGTPKVTYNWDRTSEESFSESFAILSDLFLHGFTTLEQFVIDSKNSKHKILTKTLMPTLVFLLQNLNWAYLGLPKNLIIKRKKQIKQYLQKLDSISIIKTNKITPRKALNNYKKPILRQLLN